LIFAAAIPILPSKLNLPQDQPFRPFFLFGRDELTIGVIWCMFSMLNYRQAAVAG